jgi:hypothetical protein
MGAAAREAAVEVHDKEEVSLLIKNIRPYLNSGHGKQCNVGTQNRETVRDI